MPMYQFVCRECETAFEMSLRMSQSGETQTCPDCGSLDTRKRIGAIAIGSTTSTRMATASVPAPTTSPFS